MATEMTNWQIQFFATRNDLELGLRTVESTQHLKYVRVGRYPSDDMPTISSLIAIDSLGITNAGNKALCDMYLVLPCDAELVTRRIDQQEENKAFVVDQMLNPISICFQPSGIYTEKFIICGKIATISEHPKARDLFKEFGGCIVEPFKRYNEYFVGPEAYSLYKSGRRLITSHVSESLDLDLKPS